MDVSDGPGAIRIDAEGELRSELRTQRFDCLDFDLRWEHSRLELDLFKAIPPGHLPGLAHDGASVETLAVFVVALVFSESSPAGVLIEEVCRERNQVPRTAADHVANRFAHGLADDIETGDLERREGTVRLVERVFTGDQPGLGAVVRTREALASLWHRSHSPVS